MRTLKYLGVACSLRCWSVSKDGYLTGAGEFPDGSVGAVRPRCPQRLEPPTRRPVFSCISPGDVGQMRGRSERNRGHLGSFHRFLFGHEQPRTAISIISSSSLPVRGHWGSKFMRAECLYARTRGRHECQTFPSRLSWKWMISLSRQFGRSRSPRHLSDRSEKGPTRTAGR